MQNHLKTLFVLLLDHDSVPMEVVQGVESEFQTLRETGSNIAAIGPLLYDPRDKNYLGFHKSLRIMEKNNSCEEFFSFRMSLFK